VALKKLGSLGVVAGKRIFQIQLMEFIFPLQVVDFFFSGIDDVNPGQPARAGLKGGNIFGHEFWSRLAVGILLGAAL